MTRIDQDETRELLALQMWASLFFSRRRQSWHLTWLNITDLSKICSDISTPLLHLKRNNRDIKMFAIVVSHVKHTLAKLYTFFAALIQIFFFFTQYIDIISEQLYSVISHPRKKRTLPSYWILIHLTFFPKNFLFYQDLRT